MLGSQTKKIHYRHAAYFNATIGGEKTLRAYQISQSVYILLFTDMIDNDDDDDDGKQ